MSERFGGTPRWRNLALITQYEELIRLRAEVARLLNPLKNSPPRKRRSACRNRSAGPMAQRNDRLGGRKPVLLLVADARFESALG
jgi:hypothetical protein